MALNLTPIDYGTNFPELNNKQYNTDANYEPNFKWTFISLEGIVFAVMIGNSGEVRFMRNITGSECCDSLYNYSMTPVSSKNTLLILSAVIFIIAQSKIPNVKFYGYTERLMRFYTGMTNSRSFLQMIDIVGYDRIESDPNWIEFKRR